jgi:glycogen operon protein
MLVAGDEFGRTQNGNNNAYCQDNEVSWIDWEQKDDKLREYVARLIHFRLEHPVFCRKKWFQYKPIKGTGVTDIEWFLPEGYPMSDEHWNTTYAKSLSIYLSGDDLNSYTERGEKLLDDTFYIMINSDEHSVIFTLPEQNWGNVWYKILDSADCFFEPTERSLILHPQEAVEVKGRSIVLLISDE